jgi:hypothetical protein
MYYYSAFLALRAERNVMRKTTVAVFIALSAAILGGCAGSLPGGSPLPVAQVRPSDSVGGGLMAKKMHRHLVVHRSDNDSVGGGPPK